MCLHDQHWHQRISADRSLWNVQYLLDHIDVPEPIKHKQESFTLLQCIEQIDFIIIQDY